MYLSRFPEELMVDAVWKIHFEVFHAWLCLFKNMFLNHNSGLNHKTGDKHSNNSQKSKS